MKPEEEYMERFRRLEMDKTSPKEKAFLVSKDRLLGFLLTGKEEFISLGTFKLPRRLNVKVHVINELCFDARLLRRALRVLGEKTTEFEFGLYELPHLMVFAVKKGSAVVLIAPRFGGVAEMDFEEFMGRKVKELEDIKTWWKILGVKDKM